VHLRLFAPCRNGANVFQLTHDWSHRPELQPTGVELAIGPLTGAEGDIAVDNYVLAGAGRDHTWIGRAVDLDVQV
jgi:hypothetical protein